MNARHDGGAAPPLTLALLYCACFCLAAASCARDLPPPPPPSREPPSPPPSPPAAPSFQPAAVALPSVSSGAITRIDGRDRVGLTGPRVDAKPGDWLLENAESVAVVSAEGKIVDFGAKGGRDEIGSIDPTVFLGLDAAHVEVVSVAAEGEGGHVLHVVRRVLEKPLLLHEMISFAGDRLRVETVVTASAPATAPLVVTLGERIAWGNVPTWVEGHGFVTHGGTFATDFVARDSYGVAYALSSEGGRLLARFDAPDPGFHEGPSTGESPQRVPLDAPSAPRVIAIAHAEGSLGKAAAALPVRIGAGAPVKGPWSLPPGGHLEVARCEGEGRKFRPYARFLAVEGGVTPPAGCFRMRFTAPGHRATAWFSPATQQAGAVPAAWPKLEAAATLRFAVTEKGTGRALPARVLVRGVKGTPDPDWGDDPDGGAALNVIYSETGAGERPVPPGRYRITIDRGFEYTAYEKDLEIVAGRTARVSIELERVVDTKGWISADLHLHAMPSPDAIQPLADRVRALVAAGVEVGVATDHNKVTDYRPVIDELKVRPWIASVIGDEITTRDPYYGHFNAFPLPAGAAPVPYRGVTPGEIFAAARAEGSLGPGTVVQVNHPRMARIGYLDLLRFDRDDVKGWQAKVPLGELGFDAIEVFNGDHYAMIPKVEDCMRDWYALLDAGYHVTATGNSDSHKLTFHEPGVPRNLVAVPNDDPAAFDERAFVAAVRQGRVVVSSGPFLRLEANGKGVGDTIAAGRAEVTIVVDAPAWVDVSQVQLVRRGELIGEWAAPFPKGPHRVEIHATHPLRKGDWIIAIARGEKPMGYLHRPNARPFAFTNPIWVE